MSLLVETIRINDGVPLNLEYHTQRINRSLSELFGIKKEINLRSFIKVPGDALTGVVKCRIEYDRKIRKIEFQPYCFRTDSYYANCIFISAHSSWVTPDSCLLKGTRRSLLLDKGLIREERVTVSDIKKFTEARLINAMIDIDDSESIPVNNIKYFVC